MSRGILTLADDHSTGGERNERRMVMRHASGYVGAPRRNRKAVQFFLRRPTGYLSPHTLRGALHGTRTSLRLSGRRDRLMVSVLGLKPLPLPALRGPVRGLKVPCASNTKAGTPCQQMVHTDAPEGMCRWHAPSTGGASPQTARR